VASKSLIKNYEEKNDEIYIITRNKYFSSRKDFKITTLKLTQVNK